MKSKAKLGNSRLAQDHFPLYSLDSPPKHWHLEDGSTHEFNAMTPRTNCPALLILGSALALAMHATAIDDVEIRKVNCTDLTYERIQRTADPMITFERRYLLYGAINSDDFRARRGKYFSVLWKAKDTEPGIVVRLEYLQANSGPEIHVKEMTVDKVDRQNSTHFEIIGKDYSGEWFWPDGRKLEDREYEGYLQKIRNGEKIDVKATAKSGGDVVAWKVSLVRNGVVLATSKSFLWRE